MLQTDVISTAQLAPLWLRWNDECHALTARHHLSMLTLHLMAIEEKTFFFYVEKTMFSVVLLEMGKMSNEWEK